MDIKKQLNDILKKRYKKTLDQCTTQEVYYGLLELTQKLSAERPSASGERKVYYFSAEFLMGKLLSNNLLALGIVGEYIGKIYGEVKDRPRFIVEQTKGLK